MTIDLAHTRNLSPEAKRALPADFARGLEIAAQAETTAIAPVDRTAAIPLSFAQQRLWFLEQRGGTGAAYHIPMRLRLRGALDRGALVRALDRIVARHEALRTTFPAVEGEPVQRMAPVEESAFRLVEHDLHAAPDPEDGLRRLVQDEASAPFDLEHGPLIRGRLVRMAADDHVLLLTMHHIVADGGSTGVLFRELGALYAAFARGEPDPLPPLPVQYADYAAWHRRQVEGPVLQAQAEYWTRALAGAPERLELPTDRPRPAKQDFDGASVNVELDEALTAALKALSQRHGVTLFTTLLAGWAAVLARLSGQDDVVVGTPSANRGRSEIEGLIGFFANPLALRVDLAGAPTVAELLDRVSALALEAQGNRDIPFEQVVERVQPVRSPAHTPLFQVLFDWQNAPGGSLELPGMELCPLDTAGSWGSSPQVSAKFDLSLALREDGGRITGEATYATALFDRATVERYVGYLRRVLQAMADDDRAPVDRLELLSDAERRTVVEEFNARRAEHPREAFVHEGFEAQAARTPGAAALVFEDETLSYAELSARSNRLAHHLRALGVGPDARVGICAERSLEMVVGVLGVLKAGGVYVPLDPGYPADRLAYMLADSAPAAVLVQTRLRDRVAGADVPVVALDAAAPAWASLPATDPGRGGLTPDHLAYVIYTSGSTGRPKGVRVPHGSLGATLAAAGEAFGFGAGDRVPSLASFAFDIWLFETLLPLLGGGTVRLVPRERVPDVPRLVEDLARCTVLHAVPALMRRIVEEVRATPEGVLGALRHAFVGGDAVAPDLLEEMRAAFPAAEVHVLYGPTEAAIICAAHRLGGEAAARQMVGRPLGNAALYVVEPGGGVAPVGVAGELCLGGASLARDYLGRPGLTAERFVPDPFATGPGARLYRTGDRARWLADGSVEFLGRTDFQVKVRGFRIEPGEIEARLAEHPGVRAPVVLAREDAPGDRRLVAYYLADEPVAVDALKSHLAERLPEYMVPAAYVWMETYPLTPNGKLDRNALPAPRDDAYAAREYEAPVGETEQAVAAIWAEVLGAGRVGRHDDFLDLGGHSLLATQVVSRVRELFGVELPLSALFEGPTVAELAGRVEEVRQAELPMVPAVVPIERTGPLPLSFAQERLWFLHQMEPEGTRYNGPWPSRLRGHLDASALERALNELVRRHEALRTTFRPVEQGAVQIVHPAAPAHLPVLDITGLAPQDREDEARRLAREDAERLFDLERGPLLRATLVRLSGEEHVLLLTMHHIVSDGWSMDVLFRELFTLYEWFSRPSDAAGAASPLPPLAVQYADFAVWQRAWLRGEVLQRQLDWWRERLGGAPASLELPTDRPRRAVASSRGAAHVFRIPAEIARGLRALARREGATLYMVTHAAFDLLLSRWSGQEDLVVGSPIAGRTQGGTEGLIGFFVNTLALRIDLSGDPTFQELMGRVRETALGAYAHQELPFERLVEEVAPDRGLSHTPLFQVMFALQNLGYGEGPAIAGLRLEPFGSEVRTFGSESGTVRFDLELDITEAGEELAGSLRFRTDLFDAATMERFAAQYRAVLASAVAAPEERLSRLSILPDEEVRQILAFGGGSARDGTGDAPAHLLFAAQAARTPDAPALLFAGESLTYAELDARAERLARRLRGLGVGTGTAVAVCLARGAGTVAALLAVWKAGGVYLPLDPSHPVERLAFFLRDSGAKLVVSDLPLAGALVAREADVLLLDPSAQGDLPGGELEPHGGGGPGDLAYLIYTSGSTGTPKAVMVEHAQLTHTLRASLETLGFVPGDVVAALASTTFDISLLELLTPLLAGGAVRIVPHEVARDPEELVAAVADVTVLHAVPALMRQVVEVVRGGGMLPSLRLLLVGGDSVPPGLLEDMRELLPAAQTRVLYGPTEGTIICATYAVPAEGAVAGHPLGRPLPGVRLAVRGPRGELAPAGVPGEVWISGGGVARGYLGRPELNAEKFVGAGAERAYRTGDRARWRADGVLEFLGRADEQVKVRGFRIEPGEIEAVLRGQPGVREAVVLAREDAPGDRRLVAYVVPGADGVEIAGGRAQVSEWETLFDDTYAQDEAEEDPTLALTGWNSSYTGEPIPREEMRAWVEHTAERILALRPERVLEVGCGTGLLLFRVAPHTRAYHGTDFSGVALAHVRRHAAGLPQVSLAVREADRLDDYAGAEFDVVVVNSVAQYFPDLDYLLRVLEGAAAALRPGGRIFVGDVRSLPLAGAFHASVELARASDDLPAGRLQVRVRRGMAEEQELLVDPALFEAVRARMPRLGRVEVQVKRGEYDNEVSRFRYDVVLHLDADMADAADLVVREWGGEDVDRLRALAAETASALLVRGVPDARVREHARAYELVLAGGEAADAAAVRALAAEDAGGIAPEALFALGEETGRAVEVRPGAAGTLDVLLHPAADVAPFPAAMDAERPWESYANDPQWGRRMRALVPALREAARARLPEYMVPGAFVVLEAFPVTPNGKVDRAALPAPDTLGSGGGTYVAPRTPAEERMAGIWAEVLGVERVGGEDNFFELGGHSLLATQLVSRVREAFRTELPLRAVFEAPTLAALAGRVEALRAEAPGDAGAPPLVPVPRDGSPLPLSFAQQRQWFIDQLEGAGAAYHVAWQVRLRGELDRTALARALERIVERHESLRTTFPAGQGEWEQRIAPADEHGFTLRDHDLTGCADGEGELRRLASEEIAAPFALAVGPLVRGRLVRMGPDDHALLLTMHHVVSDGWSVGVLARELEVLYTAFSRGEADPLPPLPVQYADYAVWHRRWVSSPAVEAQAEYWTETLAGAPELLELPTDRPRPARQDFAGALVKVELDEALTAALRTLAQRHGATPFMTLLAGWAVVLARLSGQNDVVVGTPSAGRGTREIEGLIGFFVNTLALRVELSGAPTVAELLRRVRERALEAQQNQDFPFEQVVERVRPARSLSHTPLFQVGLAWQEMTGGELELPGIAAAPLDGVEEEAAAFDLVLSMAPSGGRITGDVTYATALFDRATVERYVGYLRRVLQAMAADDRAPVDRLELLSAAERRRVVEEWNATAPAFPAGACVHELFEAQAERTPGAAALVFEDETLSYAELSARSNRLAHHLRALGVGPDARVGVCVERGLEMMVGVLGVLKAGGAYVPLDPGYPAERLAYTLADSAPAAVLVQTHLRDRVAGADVPVVELDASAPAWAALPATDPGRGGLRPEHLAYVIYTSGSTGRPKGVRVPHGSVGATLAVAGEAFGFGAGDRVPSLASFAFDIWLFETLLPLLGGATVRLVPRERVPDVPRLVEDLARCTVVHAVPALMRRIVEEVRAAPEGVLRTLRHAFVGGDAVAPDLLEEMRAAFPAAEIHVLYGPTEGAIICASHRLGGEAAARQMVGRPLGNAALYVVEPGGDVAAVGAPGELCLGGASVARDYLGRPGLTAERFVPDPFSSQPGARLYRTGDRVRWLADGSVEFLGRTDFQVKVRGFRIEPGEIEARLAEHPGVREAVVLVREDTRGEKRLVAYVAGDGTAGAEVLRAHLSDRLPEYMVPAAYVRLDALPLTPNGKVDRRALPAPEGDAFPARGYEAPSGTVEEAVAAIWAELLGVERVGRRDHFFELGGHSLLAVRVVSRVREALGLAASPRDVFERPVLADLARALQAAAQAETMAIAPVDRTAAIPLSFAQQRLWFLEQLGNLGSTYHIPMGLRLRGHLDRGALVRSLDRIVARHEALRTSFPTVDGEPVQRIAPVEESTFGLVEHDLHAAPDPEDGLRRLVQDEASAPFDLEHGPLVRGRLVRMAADDHVLLLTLHHIVSDGWSMGVLHRELGALYTAFVHGEPDPLPPLPVQYADYAVWHRRWVEGPVLKAQAEYWLATLAGAPELVELPTDHPRPAKQDFTGASVNVELDAALTAALRTMSQRRGTTLFMTLLAGWATVLARLSGQDEVVVGTPSANRGRSEIEGLIGFFVNMLPVRVDLSGAPSVADALRRVKARALEAQQNQDIPFEQVVERVQPARSLSHPPLFQVMFAWQNAPDGSLELPGLALAPLYPPDGARSGDSPWQVRAKFDLSLTLREDGGRIEGVVEYATALFERETVERYAGYLRRVLEGMAADDAKPVDELGLLSAAERRRLVEEWNATDAAFPAGACIHELFEAQAERTPGAVAVVFEEEPLTYRELNARANRLAHHLRARGVGPDARVAICVKRGPEMIAGLLAILKAGGAYVPLDPAYPADRLRYMLEDSAPAVLVTQSSLAGTFTGLDVPVVELDAPAPAWAQGPETNPACAGLTPGHLAYVIYTSGSTGTPKGVMVAHRSLANSTAARGRFYPEPVGAYLLLSSIAFDSSVAGVFWTLCGGGALVLPGADEGADAERIRALVERTGVTHLLAVPSLHAHLLDDAEPWGGTLRTVIVAGEECAPPLVARHHDRLPGVALVNEYGPTEATVWSTAHRCEAGAADVRVPIGRPVANTRAYVLDSALHPAPIGVPGELYVGGAQVARGYLGRPGLTAERFVPDPFSPGAGARLYRTGDRVRWSAAGNLEFLGRTDFQAKLRGFRIEPGEIEARLREHPAVREAVVLVREDAPGDKRLVAYVVGDADAETLRAHLAASLPAYMVPAAYVRLEAFPLTSNGKLDRGALPAPDAAAYARGGHEPPRTMTEQVLAEIWTELLGVERVGRRDHFFDLGGHSLLAARLVTRVRAALNPAATVEEVFAHATLHELAARLAGGGAWFGTDHAIPIRETGSERPLFVVHDAAGIVFYAQILRPHLDAEIPVYALPGPLNATDELDSLDDLVTRLVRMMAEVQPEGPYRLAGWSAGGIFAYAVAERLLATGGAVEFVGLLDAPKPPGVPSQALARSRQFTVLDLLARDNGVTPATPEALQALKEATEGSDLPAFIAECKARGLLPETVTMARAEQVDSRIALLKRTHAEFVPGPLPVPAYLFSTEDEKDDDPYRGWGDIPGGAPVRLVPVPGTHHTMWKKGNVEVVGAAISHAIRASAAGGG
ncbi:non-ribosomal peptide synthase/polyketide synthase [Longimicrobium sp.]|jgi:amino acid adenylation domain-containing protein|uniref:non-ribosomal peptide synthase/polyketide synthase n=1 Tax=Longimicrobium sp. TaxID=2029185 RepID=UPI002ED838AE